MLLVPIFTLIYISLQGKSFSIGGDAGANTITNWLRNYNEDIVGMSVGSHFAEVRSRLHYNLPL